MAAKRLLSCTTLGDEAAAGIISDVECGKTSMEIVKRMLESLQEKDVLREGVQMAFEGFSQDDIQAILAHKTAVKTDAVKRLLGIMAIDALTHIMVNENPRWKSMRLLSLFPAVTDGLRDKYNAIKAEFIDI